MVAARSTPGCLRLLAGAFPIVLSENNCRWRRRIRRQQQEVTRFGFISLRRVAVMATDGCRREFREWCEIHVSKDAPPLHDLGMYRSLRFGLLASSWIPSRVGRFFWIALHLLLIVGGPAFVMLSWLAALPIGTGFLLLLYLCFALACGLGAVSVLAIDFVHLLVRSIRFCWSVVCNHVSFLASQESRIVVWSAEDSDAVVIWACFKGLSLEIFRGLVLFVVRCVRDGLFKTCMDVMMAWCIEVVYMPDAIAI